MTATQTPWTTTAIPDNGAYADINGLHMYYETYGTGRPLVLLHGGLGASSMFGDNIQAFVDAGHRVIAPDFQGHGRTADIDRPIDVELLGSDVVEFIKHLGLDKPDVVGDSLGGGAALQAAIQAPQLIRRLVLVSVALKDADYYPELRALQGQVTEESAAFMHDTPMYQLYQSIAPRPEDFAKVVGKIGAMMAQGFDHTDAFRRLAQLDVPTLIVSADGDMASPRSVVAMYEMLGGGQRDGGWDKSGLPIHQLAIVPGETHYSIFDSPKFAATIIPFLEA